MRTYEEYRRILELWEIEPNKQKIERETGIPRGTVTYCINLYGSVANLEAQRERASKASIDIVFKRLHESAEAQAAYAYLLGIYLGDGSISKAKQHRVYTLRVSLDTKYPNIIAHCQNAISLILPDNKVGLTHQPTNCVNVVSYHKYWAEILPQHGIGLKHNRAIVLEKWQLEIVDAYPLEFFRGLYHSDGSRFSNIVKGRDYPRYQFSNKSDDIIQLFCYMATRLGLEWSLKKPSNLILGVYISKRKDVDYLDQVIGAKS